jgi:hypothetical protein
VINMRTGTARGGHAFLLVGYRTGENGGYWLVANSWGTAWGKDGFAWMHQSWLESDWREAYVIIDTVVPSDDQVVTKHATGAKTRAADRREPQTAKKACATSPGRDDLGSIGTLTPAETARRPTRERPSILHLCNQFPTQWPCPTCPHPQTIADPDAYARPERRAGTSGPSCAPRRDPLYSGGAEWIAGGATPAPTCRPSVGPNQLHAGREWTNGSQLDVRFEAAERGGKLPAGRCLVRRLMGRLFRR